MAELGWADGWAGLTWPCPIVCILEGIRVQRRGITIAFKAPRSNSLAALADDTQLSVQRGIGRCREATLLLPLTDLRFTHAIATAAQGHRVEVEAEAVSQPVSLKQQQQQAAYAPISAARDDKTSMSRAVLSLSVYLCMSLSVLYVSAPPLQKHPLVAHVPPALP